MKVEIKSRFNNNLLFRAEVGSLKLAVELAVKSDIDLRDADLRGAYLRGADLSNADLSGAYLRGAYLSGAKNINKYITTPLYALLDQPGKIRMYKLVNNKREGIYRGGIVYEKGSTVTEKKFDTDETNQCRAGINLATLDWCIKEWKDDYRILIAEFAAKDIVAIPIGSNSKFRVKRCKIVGEKDLKSIGLKT